MGFWAKVFLSAHIYIFPQYEVDEIKGIYHPAAVVRNHKDTDAGSVLVFFLFCLFF